MKTVHVQVVCRKCSAPWRTSVRGGNSRCPKCRASRYIRQDQEWEGPVPASLSGIASKAERAAARLPVWCACGHCGHEWQSRAADGMRLRCPECRAAIRAPYRSRLNTGPTPGGYQIPAPAPVSRPSPEGWETDREEWEEDPEEERGPTMGELLQGMMRALRPPALPARQAPAPPRRPGPAPRPRQAPTPPRRPAPAPRPRQAPTPARRPAPAPEPTPWEQLQERRRREGATGLASSLGGPLYVWFDRPSGACEVLDVNRLPPERECPAPVTHAVVMRSTLYVETHAYACGPHAAQLAAHVSRFEGITATAQPLRSRK